MKNLKIKKGGRKFLPPFPMKGLNAPPQGS